ncbi:MAG TPA: HupE/UreJ family protein [Acidobacteriaceae bacterium]|nr:HupE/UreJ family protein [Acidobacteriaceae bacterium]
MRIRLFHRMFAAGVLLLAANLPASAHHLMGGKTPATFTDGILSGLGHPVIGADHLAFLVAVGLAAGLAGLSLAMPAAFVVSSAVGVALHVNAVMLPAAELVVGLSVVFVGYVLASGRTMPVAGWVALFAVAGLFHGYAYGESIFGAEPTPFWAYLVGLVVIQTAVCVGVAILGRRSKLQPIDINARMTGATIAGVGLAVLAGQLIPTA